MPVNLPTKQDLRGECKSRRKVLSQTFRDDSSRLAAQHLIRQSVFQSANKIACYISFDNEVNCVDIINSIWLQNKLCYLPVLTESQLLLFSSYKKNDELIANKYGILEPRPESGRLPVEQLDLVILPLIAYDKYGRRLGTGGGYYDRTFSYKLNHRDAAPYLIGLAYSTQLVNIIPYEPWDIKLDAVVTEKGYEIF